MRVDFNVIDPCIILREQDAQNEIVPVPNHGTGTIYS